MLKTFAFLATVYTSSGPVVFELDHGLSGADCIARMHAGVTAADRAAVAADRINPAGEFHVPAEPFRPDWSTAVLSCEFDWS